MKPIGPMRRIGLTGPGEKKTKLERENNLRPVGQAAGFTMMEFAAFFAMLAMGLGVRFGEGRHHPDAAVRGGPDASVRGVVQPGRYPRDLGG